MGWGGRAVQWVVDSSSRNLHHRHFRMKFAILGGNHFWRFMGKKMVIILGGRKFSVRI